MPNILLLGVGKDQIRAIQYARELGLGVIGFDGNPKAEGLVMCDSAEVMDIRNADLVEAAAVKANKQYGIDGVMAPAVEVGPSVGRVVDVLGLRGIGERVAEIMTDKILRCNALKDAKIPGPKFAHNYDVLLWNTFPAVIKPRNQSAAVGVMLIKNAEELKGLEFDLIQEYIDGWELSTEALIMPDGKFFYVNADRNYEGQYMPYMVENGCQLPSKINEQIDSKIAALIHKLIKLWDLSSCVMKLDLIVKDNIVYVLETPPRLGGGRMSSHMIPAATGIEWWQLAIKLAMGMPVEDREFQPKYHKFCAQRYRFADKVTSNKDRPSDEIATGNTYGEAVENAERAISGIS